MRFVLHSTSLADEILSEDSPAHRLVKVSCLKEIEVIPLPTINNDLRKIFADNGLVFTEYFSHESRVVLKVSDGSIHDVTSPFANRLPENLWDPLIDNSNVTLADLNRLKGWLYRKRTQIREDRERTERRQLKEEAEERRKAEQPALFDF